MSAKLLSRFAPFGIRHEVAKRYTPADWFRSLKVAKAIDHKNSDKIISQLICSNKPGLVGRLGGTEARFIGEYLKLKRLKKFGLPLSISSKVSKRWKVRERDIFALSGFYSDSWGDIEKFSNEYLKALSNTDVLGAWGVAFTWIESIGLDLEQTKVIPVGLTAPWVEPAFQTNTIGSTSIPWVNSLEGKKVLIVSGFSDSINKQFAKRNLLFSGYKFPEFKLITLKAPMTSGQRDKSGKNWFSLLDKMKFEISSIDFDIAIVAAGAYSYPIANYVKNIGKIGIHAGGGLQLFFGIMGNRWNNSPEILKYLNQDWTRPSKEETPENATEVEGACYW